MADEDDTTANKNSPSENSEQASIDSVNTKNNKSFTFKSIFFGIIGLLITIAITGYNEEVLRQTPFVGHQFPFGPYFLILCVALIWNPLWAKIYTPLCLRSRELVVTLLIILMGCWTAGSGLNRFFTHAVISPWVKYENETSWQISETIHYVPPHLFPLGGKNYQYDISITSKGSDQQALVETFHAFSRLSVEEIEQELSAPQPQFRIPIASDEVKSIHERCAELKCELTITKQIQSVIKLSNIKNEHDSAQIKQAISQFTNWDDGQIDDCFTKDECSFEYTGSQAQIDTFDKNIQSLNTFIQFDVQNNDEITYQIVNPDTSQSNIKDILDKHSIKLASDKVHADIPSDTLDVLKSDIAQVHPGIHVLRVLEGNLQINGINEKQDLIAQSVAALSNSNSNLETAAIKNLIQKNSLHLPIRCNENKYGSFNATIEAHNIGIFLGDLNKITYDSFTTGIPQEADVPFSSWTQPLSSWLPLLIVFGICIISLSLLVHRQWASHEQLSYPLAQIGTSLLERKSGHGVPDLFRKRSFWVAAIFVFGFHFIRLLNTWYPNIFPGMNYSYSFNSFFWTTFPTIADARATFYLYHFYFFFSIVGITFFLSREIGLTLGLSNVLLSFVAVQIYLTTGSSITEADHGNTRAGGYIAYAAVILFTGRHYYWSVFVKALTFKTASEHEADGVFAARLLMLSYCALIFIMSFSFELSISIAFFYSSLTILLFMVFARITCETGIPYLQTGWQPSVIIAKLFGVSAIGAAPLVMMYYISLVLSQDPKECFMPYVANGLKLADNYKMKLKKIAMLAVVVIICAICISIAARIFQHYSIGAGKSSDAYGKNVSVTAFSNATQDLKTLKNIDRLAEPGAASHGLELTHIKTDAASLRFILFGAIGVIVFFFMRFRFSGFPLHPILFLVWGCYPIGRTFWSFLIGWFIREMIVRFGGGTVYQQCKPFFIGLIIGELVAGMLGIGTGLIYHYITDEMPKGFRVFIG
ncbi:MAG: hypothetical protein HRU15_17240 [Planctomycetes bacterium]|nr:hypothetical protein [Planctomycetota bacterium]